MKRSALSQANIKKNLKNSLRENVDEISVGNILNSMFSKKSLSLVLMFVMALNVLALPVLASIDVAYIFKNEARVDENVIEVFEDMGLSVELINEKNLPNDFSAYRFIYLGDERFRHEEDIRIWEYPTIVSNYYYGEDWGLTNSDGISQLVSTAPLGVRIGNRIVEVYNQGTVRGIGIPYYYLDGGNKAEGLMTYAETYTTKSDMVGDVVSFGEAGLELANGRVAQSNICFYGIIESDYWTNEAVELLEECIDFVGVTCENDNDCNDENLGGAYCVGDEVYQNINSFTCIDAGTVQSSCVGSPEQVLVESCSNSCQAGACICLDIDNDGFDQCQFGSPGDDGNNLDCNDNDPAVNPGNAEICDGKDNDCDGQIDEDSNICGVGSVCSLGTCSAVTCSNDYQCGLDGFFDGQFCSNDDVFQNYVEWTCENPGTVSSSCTQDVDSRIVTECSDECASGSCVSISCDLNSDCNDNDPHTEDSCTNPGTVSSYCEYEDIECNNNNDCNDNDDFTIDSCENAGSVDSQCVYDDIVCIDDIDCGVNGFVNGLSCTGDDISQDYRSYNCENPGTISASCSQTVEERVVTECSDSCSEGSCVTITCENDSDCEDGNSESTDVCLNPGSVESQCTHEDVLCSIDIDCGSDRYTGALFCEGKSIFRNFVDNSCNVPGTQASFCSNSIDAVEVYECNYACNEGSCIRCNTQTDCSDGNDGTIDSCRFGGTIDSYCSYDVVSCFDDSECGLDSFTGTPFCINDNVYQNFRDLSCTNAGTSGSFCDAESEAELVESCEFGCSAGACEGEKQCSNGQDDDSDGLTDAQDPGCWDDLSRPETYNPELNDEERAGVTCSNSVDCGIVDYIYPPFCEGNEVIDRQDVLVCNNPGTGIASCDLGSETEVLDSCTSGEICLVDSCVVDCIDSDNDGFDDCSVGQDDDDGLQLDCNDNEFSANPGATEMCNGIDDDCDGQVDENADQICENGDMCIEGSCVTNYFWDAGLFGDCSVSCGNGVQSRDVQCLDSSGAVVANSLCDSPSKPDFTQECASCNDCSVLGILESNPDHVLRPFVNLDSTDGALDNDPGFVDENSPIYSLVQSNGYLRGNAQILNDNEVKLGAQTSSVGSPFGALAEIVQPGLLNIWNVDTLRAESFLDYFSTNDRSIRDIQNADVSESVQANKLCELAGFERATIANVRKAFSSPSNDYMIYWDGSMFRLGSALITPLGFRYNTEISKITCADPILPAVCS